MSRSVLQRPIEVMRSPYRSVANVIRSTRYVNGHSGAPCTRILKRAVRELWEGRNPGRHTYVWGFDSDEAARLERLRAKDEHIHTAPLIERWMSKADAHGLFARLVGDECRPRMYALGYPNNNCIGCVKGGKGYWNKVRHDFPDVFAERAALEREIGHSCIRGVFLDELDPDAGRDKPITATCGLACLAALEGE